MSLEMSLDANDLNGKPIIGAEINVTGRVFIVYVHIEDKDLQDRMRRDASLIKEFIKENQKEIEAFLINELKGMCSGG